MVTSRNSNAKQYFRSIKKNFFSKKKSRKFSFGNFQAVTHPSRDSGERCLTSKIAANWIAPDDHHVNILY